VEVAMLTLEVFAIYVTLPNSWSGAQTFNEAICRRSDRWDWTKRQA
jgi:hypothetical protein